MRAVGATNDADLVDDERTGDVYVSGYTPKPDEEFDVELPWVSNGYLQTLGVPLMAGRLFWSSDAASETLLLAGIAVAVTVPIAVLGARAARSQFFGVSFADPLVYTAGILGIGMVAALAAFIAARRAAAVDPARALRTG